MGLDRQGRLLATEHQPPDLAAEPDLSIVTVVDRFEGKRLNSPNDFVVARDGTMFFTDPPYGLPRQVEGKELAFQGVYRLDPDGRLRLLVRDMVRPNGIGLSPDGRTLYVTDSDRAEFRAFAMRDDGTADQGRVSATLRPWKAGVQGVPDGLVVTAQGHVLVTGPGGVWVFDPKGEGSASSPPGGACGVHVRGSGREDALHHRAVARVSDANDRRCPVSVRQPELKFRLHIVPVATDCLAGCMWRRDFSPGDPAFRAARPPPAAGRS